MNPRLSRSRDKDLVRARAGEPEMMTTSFLAPVLDLLARRDFLQNRLERRMTKAVVALVATATAVSTLCRVTQS